MASNPARACSGVGVAVVARIRSSDQRRRSSWRVDVEPEQVGNDHEREGRRHVPHEVALAPLADAIEDPVAQAHDRLLHLADAARREAPIHQPAALAVLGIVHRDHHRQMHAVRARGPMAREGGRVLLDGKHVVVLGDPPHRGGLVVVDGRLPAHPRPDLVRVVRVPGAVEEVEPRPRWLGRTRGSRAGEAATALGDDVALDLAGPAVDGHPERVAERVFDQPALERRGVETAAQRVRPDHGRERLRVADHRFGARELGHRALRHRHLADRLHPGGCGPRAVGPPRGRWRL